MESPGNQVEHDQATYLGFNGKAKNQQQGPQREEAAAQKEINANYQQRDGENRGLTQYQQNCAAEQEEGAKGSREPTVRRWTQGHDEAGSGDEQAAIQQKPDQTGCGKGKECQRG